MRFLFFFFKSTFLFCLLLLISPGGGWGNSPDKPLSFILSSYTYSTFRAMVGGYDEPLKMGGVLLLGTSIEITEFLVNPEGHRDQASQEFIKANMARLREDMARGEGETLQTLAGTMGCNEKTKKPFMVMTKEKYQVLFADVDKAYATLLWRLKREITADDNLAKGCLSRPSRLLRLRMNYRLKNKFPPKAQPDNK